METAKAAQSKTNLQQDPPYSGQKWQRWLQGPEFRPFLRFGIFAAVLCLIFIQPLIALGRLALKTEMHSHIVLIPFICGYLAWIRRNHFPNQWTSALGWSLTALITGVAVLTMDWIMLRNGWKPRGCDQLTIVILGFYFLLLSGGFAFWGRDLSRLLIFPLGMFVFIVPIPGFLENRLEVFLQHASAEATSIFLSLSGTPVFRRGITFDMPNLTIEVARECSGIRSTIVLFITGLLASNLYLRTTGKRCLLVFATVPLGILRNAFRIFVLSMLTIHVNPNIINSSLHSEGGPLFFGLSLLPLFGLLILLRRSEMRVKTAAVSPDSGK